MQISKYAEKALTILNNSGYEAYVIGGAVRDSLLNLGVNDFDITTNATPNQIKQVFKDYKTIDTGIKHGTVKVQFEENDVEITTYRKESGYTDNRHPDTVEFTNSLKEDCNRRDFTINAIAYNPKYGIIDYFDGIKDIENKVIRCIGNPEERFKEDALRILRRLRFASVLGFDIEEKTKQAIFDNRYMLKNISVERIYEELKKLVCGSNIKKVICDYIDVIAVIMPEVADMKGFDQKNPHHIYDVLVHTAVVMENTPPIPQLRIAALLHDVGKPAVFTIDEDGVGHFYNHSEESLIYAKRILKELKVSASDYDLITKLVEYHDIWLTPDDKCICHTLKKFGIDFIHNLMIIKRADNKGQNTIDYDRSEEYDILENAFRDAIEENKVYSLKQLAVNGNDLMTAGIKPNEIMGEILDKLLDMVIDGKIENKKELLIKMAKEIEDRMSLHQ